MLRRYRAFWLSYQWSLQSGSSVRDGYRPEWRTQLGRPWCRDLVYSWSRAVTARRFTVSHIHAMSSVSIPGTLGRLQLRQGPQAPTIISKAFSEKITPPHQPQPLRFCFIFGSIVVRRDPQSHVPYPDSCDRLPPTVTINNTEIVAAEARDLFVQI